MNNAHCISSTKNRGTFSENAPIDYYSAMIILLLKYLLSLVLLFQPLPFSLLLH